MRFRFYLIIRGQEKTTDNRTNCFISFFVSGNFTGNSFWKFLLQEFLFGMTPSNPAVDSSRNFIWWLLQELLFGFFQEFLLSIPPKFFWGLLQEVFLKISLGLPFRIRSGISTAYYSRNFFKSFLLGTTFEDYSRDSFCNSFRSFRVASKI